MGGIDPDLDTHIYVLGGLCVKRELWRSEPFAAKLLGQTFCGKTFGANLLRQNFCGKTFFYM